VTREPTFVLTGPDGVISADGVHTAFPRIADARAALASHSTPIILGALPFDISKPAALIRPQSVAVTEALPAWPVRDLPTARIAETIPAADEHRGRIAAALTRLRDPACGLHKVVLARALRVTADGPFDATTFLRQAMVTPAPRSSAPPPNSWSPAAGSR
jgi:isochorismate synthase